MTQVLHDFLLVRGGAERLILTLAEGLDAPLVTGFSTGAVDDWATGVDVRPLGSAVNGLLRRYLVTAHRFSRLSPRLLSPDVNIYSGVLAPFAVGRQTQGRRIHYCHSPPRFLYDLHDFYRANLGLAGQMGLAAFGSWFRPRYEESIRAMDLVIANSNNVAQRLKRYLGVDARVIPPPIDTSRFRWIAQGDYFLSLARLEDYKRVDVIIEAFRRLPQHQLVIASGGGKEDELRRLAAGCGNIRFTSWTDDAQLADLIGRCRAVVYLPQDEDFGMSPLEAMAAGKPVIGVREGGLLETVVDGETGILLAAPPKIDDVIAAVGQLTPQRAVDMRQACTARAGHFSREAFLDRMRQAAGLA